MARVTALTVAGSKPRRKRNWARRARSAASAGAPAPNRRRRIAPATSVQSASAASIAAWTAASTSPCDLSSARMRSWPIALRDTGARDADAETLVALVARAGQPIDGFIDFGFLMPASRDGRTHETSEHDRRRMKDRITTRAMKSRNFGQQTSTKSTKMAVLPPTRIFTPLSPTASGSVSSRR